MLSSALYARLSVPLTGLSGHGCQACKGGDLAFGLGQAGPCVSTCQSKRLRRQAVHQRGAIAYQARADDLQLLEFALFWVAGGGPEPVPARGAFVEIGLMLDEGKCGCRV